MPLLWYNRCRVLLFLRVKPACDDAEAVPSCDDEDWWLLPAPDSVDWSFHVDEAGGTASYLSRLLDRSMRATDASDIGNLVGRTGGW